MAGGAGWGKTFQKVYLAPCGMGLQACYLINRADRDTGAALGALSAGGFFRTRRVAAGFFKAFFAGQNSIQPYGCQRR